MKVSFSGFERVIETDSGRPCVMEVHNEALFARVCGSLLSEEGRFATEPYTLWDEETELNPRTSLLFVADPFHLPWDDRCLLGELQKRYEQLYLEDEELRQQVESFNRQLESSLLSLGLQLNSNYGFRIEWDMKRYLKAFGFGIAELDSSSLLDNLMDFISLAIDSRCKRTLVFVNLKTFLTENEVSKLYEHIFFSKISVLLLENKPDDAIHDNEIKYVIDRDFLEHF